MNKLGAVLIFLCAWPGAALADLPAPDSIGDTLNLMSEAFEAHPDTERTVIDDQEAKILLYLKSGMELVVFPDNLHQKLITAENDEDRQEIFDFHIKSTLSSLDVGDTELTVSDLDHVFPVIRHKDYLAVTHAEFPEQQFYTSHSLGDTDVLYVLDNGDAVSFLTLEDLAPLELDTGRLREIAHENLQQKSGDLTIEGDGIYFLVLDGFYESSFISYPPLWQEIDTQLGEIIMAVPARDLVLFMDGAQEGSRAHLSELITRLAPDLSYPVSEHLYKWENDAWVVIQ